MNQRSGELAFMDLSIRPGDGQWVVDGFLEGQILGTLTFELSNEFGTVFETRTLDLKVSSSDGQRLELDVAEGADDPEYQVVISNSDGPELWLGPVELDETLLLEDNFSASLELTESILTLPAAASVDVTTEMRSMPERSMLTGSSLVIQRTQSMGLN
jgi:hypothetical protein